MAINKSRTPVWMKVVLIMLALVFMSSFISIGATSCTGTGTNTATTDQTSTAAINTKYQPIINAVSEQLQSDPESYTVLTTLGNQYFDWALAAGQASDATSESAAATGQLWVSARDSYARALKVKEGDAPVTVDYAITLFYSGDTANAIIQAEKITKSTPTFVPAWLNLGVFYSEAQETTKAIAALQKSIDLDPKGETGGNPDYAKQQIDTLKKGTTTAP